MEQNEQIAVDPGVFQSFAMNEIERLRKENFNLRLLVTQQSQNIKDLEEFITQLSKQSKEQKADGTS